MVTSIWGLLAIYAGCSSLAIWLGNNTKIGKSWGYVLIALLMGFILVNVGVIEASNTISTIIIQYFVPFAAVLMLFQADIRKIMKIGIKFLVIMIVTCVIILVCCIGFGYLFDVGPETAKMWGALCGNYVGNMQTLGIIVSQLDMSTELTAAISASQAVYFVIYSVVVLAIARFKGFKKHFVSYTDMGNSGVSLAETYMDETVTEFNVGLSEVAILGGSAIVVLWIGNVLGALTGVLSMIFYVTIAIILANTTKISKCKLSDTWGIWFFNMFMVSVGAGAKISILKSLSLNILIGDGVILFTSFLLVLLFIKVFKLPLEFGMLSHMAGVGGAVSTPPMAKAYGWNDLVMPGLLVGILGQVLGPYFGLACYKILASLL